MQTSQPHPQPTGSSSKNDSRFPEYDNFDSLMAAARSGDVEAVRSLIPISNPGVLDSPALLAAAIAGHLDIVRMLIPVSNPKANESAALSWAARSGHLEVVQALIPVSDPRADHSKALEEAARAGHLEVVRELIPVSDPKDNDSNALRWAAENGHLPVVRELIAVSDPHAKDCRPLRVAASGRHHQIVKERAPVSDAAAIFRDELAQVRSGIADLDTPDSTRHIFVVLSINAINALTPYVDEVHRERAVTELPARTIDRMPQLRAWREAKGLNAHLNQTAPVRIRSCRPRLSL